jgi:hypothetical protein
VVAGHASRSRGEAATAEEQNAEILRLSPRLAQLLVERMVNDVTVRYGLDERQKALFEEQVVKKVPAFFEKHRAVVEPVFNRVLEQFISGRTPTTQQVAGWADKMLPAVREATEEIDATFRTMRPHLRPEQVAHWGRDQFQFRLGCTLAEAKLRGYAAGRFDANEWGLSLPGPHQAEQDIFKQARQAGLGTTPPKSYISPWSPRPASTSPSALQRLGTQSGRPGADPSAPTTESVEFDQWGAYLQKFMAMYRLDEGQKSSAIAVLKDVQGRAHAHRQKQAPEYASLARALSAANGEELSRLQADLTALDAPIRELFEEFKGRLDQLLNESQRRQVAPSP